MRCEVKREDPRLRALVTLLDEDGVPVAQTWRMVAAAAEAHGLLRPSYPLIRRLTLAHRLVVRRRAELREVALEAARTHLVGRAPGFVYTANRLDDASKRLEDAKEACVSETQASRRPRSEEREGVSPRG